MSCKCMMTGTVYAGITSVVKLLPAYFFLNTFEIDGDTRHQQIHAICCLGKPLVDISQRIAINASQWIGWHHA